MLAGIKDKTSGPGHQQEDDRGEHLHQGGGTLGTKRPPSASKSVSNSCDMLVRAVDLGSFLHPSSFLPVVGTKVITRRLAAS
jgi:hypothetical protein